MRELLSYSFVLPPTIFIVGCIAGALIGLVRPRIGTIVVLSSSILLYLFATPAVSIFLLDDELVMSVPTDPDLARAQAIVVLGGDYKFGDGGRVPDSVGLLTLERLAAAARLYRRLGLPVVVSGGPVGGSESLAKLMREELEQNFSVPVKWIEGRSRSTYQNALYTAELMKSTNINTVIVVTQAWHMPRALWSFKRAGLNASPFSPPEAIRSIDFRDFLPSVSALHNSFYALHEMFGLAYYRIFY